jgi:hypothetical protein
MSLQLISLLSSVKSFSIDENKDEMILTARQGDCYHFQSQINDCSAESLDSGINNPLKSYMCPYCRRMRDELAVIKK